MRELLADLTQTLDSGRDCVYCAVIETRGSTPQKAGAAMLVYADGSQRGTLGGGCVEAEVKQRALRVLSGDGGQAAVLSFCLDDNYGWDDGLICGGRMTILADPLVGTGQCVEYYRRFRQLVEAGLGCTEVVVMAENDSGVAIGSRYLFDAGSRPIAQLAAGGKKGVRPHLPERPEGCFAQMGPDPFFAAGPPPEAFTRHLVPVRNRPGPSVHHGVAFLPILPRITLLIVGGGHVGQAVAKLAAEVDFETWVLDDRAIYASAERFPTAQRRLTGDIGVSLQQLAVGDIDPSIYALIVTRGHGHDEEVLYHLANTPAGYVGMIGSKRKIKMIYEDLIARGISAETLARVHAPLGFAIGSQTVPEIAISIVAELIACRNLGATIPAARVRVAV